MPLTNESNHTIYWRAFNVDDRVRIAGRPGFEGSLPSGGSAPIAYPDPSFVIEIRNRPWGSIIPPSQILVPAGPAFTPSDVIVFDGSAALKVLTQVTREVPGFLPSRSGFRFGNSFPPYTYHATINILGQTISIGDAANGLCGGMVYSARDYHQTGKGIPSNTRAPLTGVLFDHIVKRLYDSFALPFGWTRYLFFMDPARPSSECLRITINEEWPRIRADIDAGALSPIGLVTVRTSDLLRIGLNHQVLVYGYTLNGTRCRLRIYDPNCPGCDDVFLDFETTVAAPNMNYSQTLGGDGRIHAFFQHPYTFVTPPAIEQVPSTIAFPSRHPFGENVANFFDGNGWLGLMRIQRVVGTSFTGTLYGQSMDGSWDPANNTVQFRRKVEAGYDQLFTGRYDRDGVMSGTFQEIRDGAVQPGQYAWRAVCRLFVDGNGWPGELLFDQLDTSGAVAGRMYGDTVSGEWDRASNSISLTRRGSNPDYSQQWTGRRVVNAANAAPGTIPEFVFQGEFREIVNGSQQPTGYRWVIREC